VEKDLNVAGGNLNINGNVGDDARIAGGNISINGPVASDLIVAGGNVTVSQKASVGGDLFAATGNLTVDSEVKGRVDIRGGSVTINGKIDGGLNVIASQELVFGPNSQVTGKITYSGVNAAVVRDGAKVSPIEFTKVERRGHGSLKALFAIATLFKLLALLVAGLVLNWLFPAKVASVVRMSHQNVMRNLGIGVVTLIVPPFLAILLCITVVGLYLGIIVFLTYLLLLIFTGIYTLFYVGNLVFSWYQKNAPANSYRDLVIGAILLLILGWIPFIGWLICAIVYLIALGALTSYYRSKKELLT
jgi:hypothetical protein